MDNNKKTQIYNLYKNSSFRIFLYAYITLKESNEINKKLKVNFNYKELESFLKLNVPEIIKFLYFNKDYVHQILYDEENEISINTDDNKKSISYIFYLSLLIMDNIDVFNYSYKIDYIRKINNYYRNEKDKYLLIISSKIIVDLINNLKGTKVYDKEENKKELNSIEEESKNIIKNNINIFNEIKLNINEKDIISKKIDEIYIGIIKALFKLKKIDDYSYTSNIINQLDLQNIYITQTMYNGIYELLKSNEDYINDYIINNKEDLFNEKKINFYYILLKYILKNSIYIYHIPFLIDTRKNILKIIKSKEYLNNNVKEYNKKKFIYIIKTFLDSEYYYSKPIPKLDLIKINEVLNYYKEYLFESKKEDIKIIENIINNNEEFYFIYLYDYNIAEKMNKRVKIIKYLYNKINNINDENKIKEEELNQYIIKWNNYEKIIKDKEFNKLNFEKNEKLITEYFNNINNKEDLLKIFSQEEYNNFLNLKNDSNKEKNKKDESTTNNSQQSFSNNEKEESHRRIESNNQSNNNSNKIQKNNPSINIQHNNLSNNIIQDNLSNNIQQVNSSNNSQQNNISNNIQQNTNNSFNGNSQDLVHSSSSVNLQQTYKRTISNSNTLILNNPKEEPNYKIIEFIKIIGKHKISAKYIKELNKTYSISGGPYGYHLYYNLTFDKVKNQGNGEDKDKEYELEHYAMYPDNKLNNKEDVDLIICTNEKVKKISIKDNKFSPNNISDLEGISKVKTHLKIIADSIICGEKGIFLVKDLLEGIVNTKMYKMPEVSNSFFTGIKINNIICAFTSNKLLMNGDDIIIFYNNDNKKILNQINGYPFILSQNNLAVIPGEESQVDKKIILCACKNYIKDKKNGILLLTYQIKSNRISESFYDTGNFEIYCFCPISLINMDFLFKDMHSIENIKYFFVGGFDNNKKEGLIKLYKIIYNKKNFQKTKIKYMQDIRIEKDIKNYPNYFNGFNGPITCITQSKHSGNILISCFDGNVYLFTIPNYSALS